MAYAAVISLENTIEHLLTSSHTPVVASSREILEFAYKELKSLQEILQRLDNSSKSNSRKRVNVLDAQIREDVSRFEDVLEFHILDRINTLKSKDSIGDDPLKFSAIDLQDLRKDVYSFTELVKKTEKEYVNELENPLLEEEDETLPLKTDVSGKMVGLSDILSKVRDRLHSYWGFGVVALVGMAGIGKTIVAKEIFVDPFILGEYEHRAWVTIGRKYQLSEITRDILTQVDPDTGKILTEGDEKISLHLKEILKKRVCFIVLDDVWDTYVWDHLKSAFPDNNYGRSKILLTTRLEEVAKLATGTAYDVIEKMRLLNEEESWDLLREKLFGEEPCPPELRKVGKKISQNCEGLPLMIVKVADLLSKADKTPEYWNMVAEKQNSVFMNAYDEISKVLNPSYEYLPQYLKSFFLYMGVFPQNYEIPVSKLINLWIAEGSLQPNITPGLEDRAENCLEELVSNSLIIICQMSTSWWAYRFSNYIKTCRLHSSLWHLCHKIAEKNKFFHTLNSRVDGLKEDIKIQRRLCFHNNVLFATINMYNSIEDDCPSSIRSLLCFGPYHQYPVPINFGLRLLRVLDALHVRLYEFPVEVLKLVQLRYLALTYNGDIPASISKLWNLQFLIIHRHLRIRSSRAMSYIPIEIWDMQELKHLQIMGTNLPNSICGNSLKNLQKLLGVSGHSCTESVLHRISNLEKLGIEIELVPDDDNKSFHCLNHISCLPRLKSLKCIVVNPISDVVASTDLVPMFPSCLKKLHLSGLGYPWKFMNVVASLPNLEVLKLRCYAFRGPKWEVEENGFFRLRYLLIEDTDLVHLKVGFSCLKWLGCISLKHCYKLDEIHWESISIPEKVEVIDCGPSAMTLTNQIKMRDYFKRLKDVCVLSSWNDGNLKS